jgi:hypothetical protein
VNWPDAITAVAAIACGTVVCLGLLGALPWAADEKDDKERPGR